MNSRRKFIFDCSTVVAALTVAPISSFSKPATSGAKFQALQQMSYTVLAGQVNTIFRVRVSPRQVVELKLLKAPLARPVPVGLKCPLPGYAEYERFSLIFNGPKDELLADAIHWFEHEELGRFEMFIGRIGRPQADGVRYEAGFNRPPPMASASVKSTSTKI